MDGLVRAADINLDGNDQADRHALGGHDKAVDAHADEDRRWWEIETTQGREGTAIASDARCALVHWPHG